MICDASGRSLQWRSATVPCLVELSVPGKGFRCCLKALGIGRELTWWQCIHSWSFFETLIPNDPLGFVFEEPQFSSDGGIPCSTCCSHLALVVTVAYQPHSCACEHCWTDSLKKKTFIKVRNTRKGGLLCFAPPCATWVFLTLVCISFRMESWWC